MDTPLEALPIAEIVRRYPDEWVLVEETAWDTHGHPTAGLISAAKCGTGEFSGSRCAAVITTGRSPPSCFIRVIRFLLTSPFCYETPWRSHPWPAGVRWGVLLVPCLLHAAYRY